MILNALVERLKRTSEGGSKGRLLPLPTAFLD